MRHGWVLSAETRVMNSEKRAANSEWRLASGEWLTPKRYSLFATRHSLLRNASPLPVARRPVDRRRLRWVRGRRVARLSVIRLSVIGLALIRPGIGRLRIAAVTVIGRGVAAVTGRDRRRFRRHGFVERQPRARHRRIVATWGAAGDHDLGFAHASDFDQVVQRLRMIGR